MMDETSFVERLKKWMIDNNINQNYLCKKNEYDKWIY